MVLAVVIACSACWLPCTESQFCRAGCSCLVAGCCFPSAQQLWQWMQTLPDANGRSHGVGLGSLETRAERSSMGMKPTAASLR